MTRVLIRRADDGWQWAPWNNGAGGKYQPFNDDEVVEFWEEAIRESSVEPDAAAFVGEMDNGLMIDPAPLTVGRRHERRGQIWLAVDGLEVEVLLPDSAFEASDQLPALDRGDLSALANLRGLSLTIVDGTVTWLNDGGQDLWILERRRHHQAAADRRLQAELNRRHEAQDSFINPYTYAPVPEMVVRHSPRGHASMGKDGLSGWFDWVLTLKTPMLMPVDQKVTNGTLELPGSGLRGALRNLHENLAGGCLRILDADYVPVHRDPMAMNRQGYRLAVVEELDEVTGRVTKLRLTNNLAWVNRTHFNSAFHVGGLYSGLTCSVNGTRTWDKDKRRYEIQQPTIATGTGWVLNISATTKDRNTHNYYVAVGELTNEFRTVDEPTWNRFVRVCEGAADLIGVEHPEDTSGRSPGDHNWPQVQVRHAHQLVGSRRKVDGWLGKGDTVWLTPKGDLKMAVIWRTEGEHPVRDRVSEDLLPCRDPNCLCPTCQVLGSIDNEATDTSEQAAYASHVRVDWGTAPHVTTHTNAQLPPLRSPRPSSGGFSLQTPPNANLKREDEGTPLAHWGSRLDPINKPRPIRGRKFYWHGQVEGGRQTARHHQITNHATQLGTAEMVPAGTVITSRVWFDNLDQAQLGWLLAAADPSLMLGDTCQIHLGGGKPLGFGSAEPTIKNLTVCTAASRYASPTSSVPTKDVLLAAAAAQVAERALEDVHAALAFILKPDAIHADRIWYTPPRPFSQQGQEDFDKSFDWFAKHSGGRGGNLIPLPDATSRDQYLPTEVEEQ